MNNVETNLRITNSTRKILKNIIFTGWLICFALRHRIALCYATKGCKVPKEFEMKINTLK